MKRLLTLATVALVAFPLLAAEEKKPAQPSTPAPEAQSPMVAAAKRTNRAASKGVVITNESLKDAKGHVTTTTIISNVTVPKPEMPEEVKHNDRKKKEAEAQAAQAETQKKKDAARKEKEQRIAAAAEGLEGGYSDADPAVAEQQLDEATKDQSTEPKKP